MGEISELFEDVDAEALAEEWKQRIDECKKNGPHLGPEQLFWPGSRSYDPTVDVHCDYCHLTYNRYPTAEEREAHELPQGFFKENAV